MKKVKCETCGKLLKDTPANLRNHERTQHGIWKGKKHGTHKKRGSLTRARGLELLVNGSVAETFKQVADGIAALQEVYARMETENRDLQRQVKQQADFFQLVQNAMAQSRKEHLEEVHNN